MPSRQGVRVFESDKQATAVLGPHGRYVLRVRDDGSMEVHEPFVLKKAVVTVAAPARPEKFEFSPDGGRVAVSLADTSVAIWDTAPWTAAIDAQVAKAVPADLGRCGTTWPATPRPGCAPPACWPPPGTKAVRC